jgi:hypothetical protein
MKFLDLMPELRAGYSVTKKSWNDKTRKVVMDKSGKLFEKHFGNSKFTAKIFSPTREAGDADDWTILSKEDK